MKLFRFMNNYESAGRVLEETGFFNKGDISIILALASDEAITDMGELCDAGRGPLNLTERYLSGSDNHERMLFWEGYFGEYKGVKEGENYESASWRQFMIAKNSLFSGD